VSGGTPSSVTKSPRKVQTTLRLPRQLYERPSSSSTRGNKRSVNDLIVNALTAYVRAMEEERSTTRFRLVPGQASISARPASCGTILGQ